MSSVTSQRALILALGGISIAALFVWYIQSKKKAVTPKQRQAVLENITNISSDKKAMTNSTKNDSTFEEAESENNPSMVRTRADIVEKGKEEENKAAAGAAAPQQKISVEQISESPKKMEQAEKSPEPEVSEEESDHAESSGGRSVSEGDYDVEEQVVCEKRAELMLDVLHGQHENFSWSDEMERSYLDSLNEKEEERDEYDQSESPGVASQNSEDSGRATGGLASSLSPMDEAGDSLPMYEFEIPNTLVGLIIGVKGKTIKELSQRTGVRILIRAHHTPDKVNTYQICQVRGKRDQINRCLQMLRRRFPPARFPELNLQPVLPPPIPNNLFDAIHTQPSWLTLPDGVSCEVVVSSIIDPGHFFLQQPTHPSFSSLNHLDMYMLRLYSQGGQVPELPKPTQAGLLCAAPVLDAWFRAVTVCYYAETDDVLVRFVDYGGYTNIPRGDLRQIRTDLMSLPFQSTECYLAHIQPVDGTWQWGEAAMAYFQKMCMGKVITATVVGTHTDDKVPMVELSVEDTNGKVMRMDRSMLEAGLAKAADPSKMQKMSSATKRPSIVTQISQTAVSASS